MLTLKDSVHHYTCFSVQTRISTHYGHIHLFMCWQSLFVFSGAMFLQTLAQKYKSVRNHGNRLEDKSLDNAVMLFAFLYTFKVNILLTEYKSQCTSINIVSIENIQIYKAKVHKIIVKIYHFFEKGLLISLEIDEYEVQISSIYCDGRCITSKRKILWNKQIT